MVVKYILEKKDDFDILINENITSLFKEYKEFEANKYKLQTLLIIINNDDIITLKSKELFNDYYQWSWIINNDKIIVQNKKMTKTNEIKPYKSIVLGLEVLKKYI